MADVSPTNVWPELDGKRVAGRAQNVVWQLVSTDDLTWVNTSSSSVTHYSVSLSSMVGLQPYPGTSSRMVLKGSHSALIQIAQEAADTSFFYHDDVWLGSTNSTSHVSFVASSSDESFYFGSSSSTAVFVLSTAQASTLVYLATAMPMNARGVRVWEAE